MPEEAPEVCVCAWHWATSPDQCLLLMSSESLMSLREHRLLFRVLPVPASVRPAGHEADRPQCSENKITFKLHLYRNVFWIADLIWELFLWRFPKRWCWESPGSFSSSQSPELVLTLPVCPPRRRPSNHCSLQDLCTVITEKNRFVHLGEAFFYNWSLSVHHHRAGLTVSSCTSSFLSGMTLMPPVGFFAALPANCFSIFLASSLILFSKKWHIIHTNKWMDNTKH